MSDEKKQCKTCWRIKPIDKFEASIKSRDGKMTICTECRRARASARLPPPPPPARRAVVRRDDAAWVAEGWAMLRRNREEICGE